MGLFSSKSTNQNVVTNQTTNNMADNRIGVADDATALIGGDGSSLQITNTQNNVDNSVHNVVDPAALTALSVAVNGGLETLTGMTSDLIDGIGETQRIATQIAKDAGDTARDLFDKASGITDRALQANERTVDLSLASGERNLASSLNFGRDALKFAEVTQGELADLFDTFGDRLEHDADENRAYSAGLVGDVLQQARTSDERNIQEFLSTAKWIVGIVIVGLAVSRVYGK